MDDDIEEINVLHTPTKLFVMKDIPAFFEHTHNILKHEGLFIWGVYPVRNPFFMKQTITTDLRFLIGGMYGFINRRIKVSDNATSKEDYELTILHYLRDGGVVRFNNIAFKTKFYANGGLGFKQGSRAPPEAVGCRPWTRFVNPVRLPERARSFPCEASPRLRPRR